MRTTAAKVSWFQFSAAFVLAATLIAIVGCGGGGEEEANNTPAATPEVATETDETTPRVTPVDNSEAESPFNNTPKVQTVTNPVVIFRTSHGEITVELDAKNAPVTPRTN